jgi:hypothetical protein
VEPAEAGERQQAAPASPEPSLLRLPARNSERCACVRAVITIVVTVPVVGVELPGEDGERERDHGAREVAPQRTSQAGVLSVSRLLPWLRSESWRRHTPHATRHTPHTSRVNRTWLEVDRCDDGWGTIEREAHGQARVKSGEQLQRIRGPARGHDRDQSHKPTTRTTHTTQRDTRRTHNVEQQGARYASRPKRFQLRLLMPTSACR